MTNFINNIETKLKHSQILTSADFYELLYVVKLNNPVCKPLFKYDYFLKTISRLHLSKSTIINLIQMYGCKFRFSVIKYDLDDYYTSEDKQILRDYIEAPDVVGENRRFDHWHLYQYLNFFAPVGYNHEEMIRYTYEAIEKGYSSKLLYIFRNLSLTQQAALLPESTIISLIGN